MLNKPWSTFMIYIGLHLVIICSFCPCIDNANCTSISLIVLSLIRSMSGLSASAISLPKRICKPSSDTSCKVVGINSSLPSTRVTSPCCSTLGYLRLSFIICTLSFPDFSLDSFMFVYPRKWGFNWLIYTL